VGERWRMWQVEQPKPEQREEKEEKRMAFPNTVFSISSGMEMRYNMD
jgi:hypothetical protein